MVLSQHAAVVSATRLILADEFQAGVDVRTYVTKAQKEAIVDEVNRMLVEGEAELSPEAKAKYGDKLRSKYVVGMVTNWFTRSKELNGGVKHEAKNPGSRAGSKDERISNLRAMKKNLEAAGADAAVLAKIDEAITQRLSELRSITKMVNFATINYTIFGETERKAFAEQLEGLGVDISEIAGLAEFASVEEAA